MSGHDLTLIVEVPSDFRSEPWQLAINVGQLFQFPVCIGGWCHPGWDDGIAQCVPSSAAPSMVPLVKRSGFTGVGRVTVADTATGLVVVDFGIDCFAYPDPLVSPELHMEFDGTERAQLPKWAVPGATIEGVFEAHLDAFPSHVDVEQNAPERRVRPSVWKVTNLATRRPGTSPVQTDHAEWDGIDQYQSATMACELMPGCSGDWDREPNPWWP